MYKYVYMKMIYDVDDYNLAVIIGIIIIIITFNMGKWYYTISF